MGGRGTINPVTGFVSVSSAGSSSIIYTTTNVSGCSAFITKSITINSLPVTPTIAYAPGTVGITTTGGVCKGKTFNVVGSPVNGYTTSWSLTNSNGSSATITPIVIPVVGAQIQSGSTNGRISVQYSIEDNNHCINSRTTSVNIVSCGSKETKAAISTNNSFLMYPNPAKGTLKIKLDNLVGQGTLRITNLVGKEVKIQAMSLGNNNIDINNLSKGVYLVSLVTTNGKATQKLVIE